MKNKLNTEAGESDSQNADHETTIKLHSTLDASVWAKEFKRICDEKGYYCDEGWMLSWFANAIMVGWDHAKRELEAQAELSGDSPRPRESAVQAEPTCVEHLVTPIECFTILAALAAKPTLSEDEHFDYISMLMHARSMAEKYLELREAEAPHQPSQDSDRKLVWLVELFHAEKSEGWWTGTPKDNGGWRTENPWAAKQFSESEAKAVASALDYFPAPFRWSHWLATEHVFIKGEYSHPRISK